VIKVYHMIASRTARMCRRWQHAACVRPQFEEQTEPILAFHSAVVAACSPQSESYQDAEGPDQQPCCLSHSRWAKDMISWSNVSVQPRRAPSRAELVGMTDPIGTDLRQVSRQERLALPLRFKPKLNRIYPPAQARQYLQDTTCLRSTLKSAVVGHMSEIDSLRRIWGRS
jgi:hypothetical protein